LQALIRDVRVAVRALRKSAGFTLTAMVCIALGICVTTTIFSAVDAILFRPLPYPDADRLVAVYSQNVALGYHGTNISYNDYASWRDENQSFASLGIWAWVTKTITQAKIGVRVALGAARGVVLRLVVAEGLRLLSIGLVTGIGAALLLSRALVSLLYGVSATDVITVAVVCAALTIMTLIATYVPALRAARVDPLIAMRAD
jgi:hypothetical protein